MEERAGELLEYKRNAQTMPGPYRNRWGADGKQNLPAESEISPRVAAEARRVTRAASGPLPRTEWARAARAIESYLRSDRFQYSLDARAVAAAPDPVEAFLLTVRRGFCEHFASAMTLMCQSLGMQAR